LATTGIPNMTDHENHNVANTVVQWDFPLRNDEFLDIFYKTFVYRFQDEFIAE
jgi:hypothetical protein